jgi:hypothetical protein
MTSLYPVSLVPRKMQGKMHQQYVLYNLVSAREVLLVASSLIEALYPLPK